MRWFRAEESTPKASMELFREVDRVLDTLNEADMDATPGRIEDILNAQGIAVTITQNDEGTFIVKRRQAS